jgi:hypothetical protein
MNSITTKYGTIVLGVLVILLGGMLIWQAFPGGVSRDSLVATALSGEDSAERQQAALQLVALDGDRAELKQILGGSNDPAVRMIAIQAMADTRDPDLIEELFELANDDNLSVRASASGGLDRLLRRPNHIPVEGTAAQRAAAIAAAKERWKLIKAYGLKDELAKATSVSYFYDQHTQQIFEAPSHMPSAFELPAGPYQGMPAAVKAAVLTSGNADNPSQRFVGWLAIDDHIYEEHGGTLPAKPADSESKLICRPGDTTWVYAASSEGRNLVDAALADASRKLGRKVSRSLAPGR